MLTQASEFQTRLHFWPVGPKFLLTILAMTCIVLLPNLGAQFAILAIIAALYFCFGKAFFQAGLRGLKPLMFFVIVIMIWNGIWGNLEDGALVTLRLVNSVAIANVFTLTTRLDDLIAFLKKALRPFDRFGLNTSAISLALALAIRFVPILLQKSNTLTQSWRARSKKHVNYQIIIPLTLLALDDASQIAEAMRARGGVQKTKDET